jgi:ABC-type Fe3+/spermidine/putrescine transport system ATPase subunit
VANFLGVSNLIEVKASGPSGDGVALEMGSGVSVEALQGDVGRRGAVQVVIRPERVRIESAGVSGTNKIPAVVTRTVYLGNGVRVFMDLTTGQQIVALVQSADGGDTPSWTAGARVTCCLPASAMRVLPAAL